MARVETEMALENDHEMSENQSLIKVLQRVTLWLWHFLDVIDFIALYVTSITFLILFVSNCKLSNEYYAHQYSPALSLSVHLQKNS